jgi:hypothetical protein
VATFYVARSEIITPLPWQTFALPFSLNTGIGSHDGYSRAYRLGMTHIAALVVTGDTERLRIETDLRHGLSPSANAQGVLRGLG